MAKHVHEIRDPIHTFVRLDSAERQVLDSRPFQRLRHIHQLALTYLVYPGATHKRFEHSLGVMELASRVFDTVTSRANVTDRVRDRLRQLDNRDELAYWRCGWRLFVTTSGICPSRTRRNSTCCRTAGTTNE